MSEAAKNNRRFLIFRFVFALLGAVLLYRLFHRAWLDSGDFSVYWRTAQAWLSGSGSPYGVLDPHAKGFVFKYPPWIIPLFAPFGLVSKTVAKAIWIVLEFACLFYSIKKVIRSGASQPVAFFVITCLWWMLQEHFQSGQFTLFMLVAALWITPLEPQDSQTGKSALLHAVVGYVFTAKIFSVVTLFGKWSVFRKPCVILISTLLIALPTLLVWAVIDIHDPQHQFGLTELFQQFLAAAHSGGVDLGEVVVRGPMNHGFVAAILRSLHVGPEKFAYDAGVCIGLSLVLGLLWNHYSRSLRGAEAWAGWIALGAIVQPLAWDHTFVLVYPLLALSLERTIQSKQKRWIGLSLLGIVCVGLLVPAVFGPQFVKPFDYIGAKSWGVVISACALILA